MKTIRMLGIVFVITLCFGALNFTSLVQDWNMPLMGVEEVYAGTNCKWGIASCGGAVIVGCQDPHGWIPYVCGPSCPHCP